jgi:transcriptional regulator with XRE-family HTH domain
VKLKELRIKAVLSQEDLGIMAGISAATVNRLERSKQKPNFKTIRKLAKALGVEPGEIEF